MPIDTSLLGKPIEQMTPAELSTLQSQLALFADEVNKRQKSVVEAAQATEFKRIIDAAKVAAKNLGWAKFPKLQILPNDAGDDYRVDYIATKVRGTHKGNGEKRAAPEVDSGKITLNKIIKTMGELDKFEVAGKQYDTVKDVVMALVNPKTNKTEAENCWEIARKGISGSDIITTRHGKDVTLVFKNGTRMTVDEAVTQLKSARTQVATTAAPAAAEIPV